MASSVKVEASSIDEAIALIDDDKFDSEKVYSEAVQVAENFVIDYDFIDYNQED